MSDASGGVAWGDERLAKLNAASRELASLLALAELRPRLLERAVESVHAQSGSLILLDARGQPCYSAVLIDGEVRENLSDFAHTILEHGLAGWVVRFRRAALISDTAADPRWFPDARWLMGPKSLVAVPLLGREHAVGALTLGRTAGEAFTPADQALTEALATQAGIALENAQRFAAERRERDISNTLREVARSVNATLDLERVLALVLEHLSQVVSYTTATVLLRQDGRLRVAAARGFSDPQAVLGLSFDAAQGLAGLVVRERASLVVDDVRRRADWVALAGPENEAIRAWIGAPLVAQDEVLGLLAVDSRRPGAYSPEDAQVVAAVAEQAAAAVLNARLFAQSERRASGLRALAATAQAISGALDLGEVLRLVVGYAQECLGMEGASLALIDGQSLIFREVVGPVGDHLRGMSIQLGAGVAGWVALNNQPIVVPDVRLDARFFKGVDERTGFVTRALACVPVRIEDRPIGVIEVVNPASGSFEPETLELLDSLASLAGTAIVQARRMAELQAAENRFAGLFEDSLDPVVITDLEGLVTDANQRAAQVFDYSRAELVGMRINQLHRVQTDKLTRGRFRPLLNGRQIRYETRVITRRGTELPVEVYAKLIERGGQQFIQWVQHDLSERLAVEELRNDLMSMIVHDLRSPLANVISALDMLDSTLPADETAHNLVSIAERAALRLSRLVDSLLDLRRLEAGELSLNRAPTDLAGLLSEALEQIQPTAAAKRLELRSAIAAGLPPLPMDADLIRRVVINLLDNAVKYTPVGGCVELSAVPGAGQVVVSVRDTGPGIPPADQQRIFDKFARVQRAAAPKGLGLGLAFCKLTIDAHGGRIWVESGGGRGAIFRFSLPLAGEAQAAPAAASAPPQP